MKPPIFATCAAYAPLVAEITDGDGLLKLYPFGEAPQGVTLPYVVYQTVGGSPFNTLTCPPDKDQTFIQVDVYANTVGKAQEVARLVRDAVEGVAHVTALNGDFIDPETNNRRYSFDVAWISNSAI